MGIKGVETVNGKSYGWGNLVSLKPITTTTNTMITTAKTTTTTNNKNKSKITSINKNKIPKTRVIRISEELHKKFVSHSRRFYNVETYDQILNNLLNYYEENHKETFWYNRER